MHIGIEVAPHIDGEPPRVTWWPPIRMRLSLRSIYAAAARAVILERAAAKARDFLRTAADRAAEMRADADHLVAHAEMPAPMDVPATLAALGLDDVPPQRCRS